MAYSDTSDEEVDLNDPNLDAALHQAEQLLGIPPEQARWVSTKKQQDVNLLPRCIPKHGQPCRAAQEYKYDDVQQPGQVTLYPYCESRGMAPFLPKNTLY